MNQPTIGSASDPQVEAWQALDPPPSAIPTRQQLDDLRRARRDRSRRRIAAVMGGVGCLLILGWFVGASPSPTSDRMEIASSHSRSVEHRDASRVTLDSSNQDALPVKLLATVRHSVPLLLPVEGQEDVFHVVGWTQQEDLMPVDVAALPGDIQSQLVEAYQRDTTRDQWSL